MNPQLTEKQRLELKNAQSNYITLHEDPKRQAKAIAKHYTMMGRHARKLESLLSLRTRTFDPELEMLIVERVGTIRERHFKDFGIALDWKKLNNAPQ